MKDLEPQIDAILEKDIGIMHKRAGQPVDLDLFFNMISSGEHIFVHVGSLVDKVLDCYSMLTFGKSKDLVEKNEVDGSIHAIHGAWKYSKCPSCHFTS